MNLSCFEQGEKSPLIVMEIFCWLLKQLPGGRFAGGLKLDF